MSADNKSGYELPKHSHPCPEWATELLSKLRAVEIKLGNLHDPGTPRDPNNKENQWLVRNLDELDGGQDELANALFDRVCRGLFDEGLSPDVIAAIINERLGGGGKDGTIRYCNADNVRESLK
jgi:hypothetical protein